MPSHVSVTMRTMALAWACIACSSHGRRVQTEAERAKDGSHNNFRLSHKAEDTQFAHESSFNAHQRNSLAAGKQSHSKKQDGSTKPFKALALLLLSLDLAGFHVSCADALPLRCKTALSSACATRTSPVSMRAAVAVFEEKREALKQCLTREYTSFFRPFEQDFYSDAVTFKDPLNELDGRDSYKGNVEMLSGESLIGNILFSDGFIDLHAVEDVPGDPTRLRTRWTLGFTFKLLPWKPKALFTGVSEYGIDPSSALVLSQRDYWDTLSLQDGGSYVPEDALAGLVDLAGQLLPDALRPAAAQEPPVAEAAKWSLLRRAKAYRIYRAQDGVVFAIEAPGYEGGLDGVQRELRLHGLTPGAQTEMRGVRALQLETPHPWA